MLAMVLVVAAISATVTPDTGSVLLCVSPDVPDAVLLMNKPAPRVELIDAAGSVHFPIINTDAPYLFENVTPGRGTLKISGGHWQPASYTVDVKPGLNEFEDAFPVRLGGSVQLSAAGVLEEILTARRNTCDPKDVQPEASFVLSRCVHDDCESVAITPIKDELTHAFEGLKPGKYRGEIRVADAPIVSAPAEVMLGKTVQLKLDNPTAYFVRGRVTSEGTPMIGSVRFRTGSTATDERGNYVALLSGPPRDGPVYFSACDDTLFYGYRPPTPVLSGSTLDIDVPMNEVEVDVRDSRSGKHLPSAAVTVATLMAKEDRDRVFYQVPGQLVGERHVVKNLEEGIPFRVCAELTGYKRRCSDDVQLKKHGREQVSLGLQPVDEKSGKVLASGYTNIYWARPDGTVTETTRIQDDGSFKYQSDHGPGEVIVLVGAAPLFVTMAPPSSPNLEIRVDVREKRDLTVALADGNTRRNALIALWVNGVRIPHQALFTHQTRHQQRAFIIQRKSIVIPEIGSSKIAVAAGPDPELLPRGTDIANPALFTGAQLTPVTGADVQLQ